MKRFFLLLAAVSTLLSASAQDIFNHLGIGVGVGTTGINVDLAMPVTKFITIRPGFNYFPGIKANVDMELDNWRETPGYNIPDEVAVQGKLNFVTGKVLLDFHPVHKLGLKLVVGAYFGKSNVIDAYNREDGILKDVTAWNNEHKDEQIGAMLGDYLLVPDARGNVNAQIKTKNFRPYVGIGFGHAIPKHLCNFSFELGCQFWGSPKVYCNGEELNKDKVGDGDGGIIKAISKISVYPCISFRLGFRVF